MKTYAAIALLAMLCAACGGKSTSSDSSSSSSGQPGSWSANPGSAGSSTGSSTGSTTFTPWSGSSWSDSASGDAWWSTFLDHAWSGTPSITTACQDANWTLNALTGLPPGFDKIGSRATVYRYGSFVVIESNDIPDHGSPYFPYWDWRYELPLSYFFRKNGNSIAYQHVIYFLPLQPSCTDKPAGLGSGIVGVALNGVALYSQYADTDSGSLTEEAASFDQYNGHPDANDIYHYHLEPYWLTSGNKSGLIGWAMDGFPIYGPKNPDGSTPMLDDCNGQFSATAEFPGGIYHYHVTAAPPYLVGCLAGKPGTISR